jgi:hypothetical protein
MPAVLKPASHSGIVLCKVGCRRQRDRCGSIVTVERCCSSDWPPARVRLNARNSLVQQRPARAFISGSTRRVFVVLIAAMLPAAGVFMPTNPGGKKIERRGHSDHAPRQTTAQADVSTGTAAPSRACRASPISVPVGTTGRWPRRLASPASFDQALRHPAESGLTGSTRARLHVDAGVARRAS